MSKYLFVIEAPGKVSNVRSLIEQAGVIDFDVFATSGRLYDLSSDSITEANNEKISLKYRPISSRVIGELALRIGQSEKVYVMTDSDIEGELIADHVLKLSQGKAAIFRSHIKEMTAKGLAESINNPEGFDADKIDGAVSRRVFDRLVGYQNTSPHGKEASLGRITIPVISSLNNDKPDIGHFSREVIDQNGETWTLHAKCGPRSYGKEGAIESIISTIDHVVSENKTKRETLNEQLPLNGFTALERISFALDLPIPVVAAELQSLYERGDISYPRTDTSKLSPHSSRLVRAHAEGAMIHGFDGNYLHQKSRHSSSGAQGAHEGIYPLTSRINVHIPLESLSVQDRVLSLITRHTYSAGQKDRRFWHFEADIISNQSNNNQFDSLIQMGVVPKLRKSITFRDGFKRILPYDEVLSPMGVDFSAKIKGKVSHRKYRPDYIVARRMIELGLGRPSAIHTHAEKISKKFFDASMELNGRGMKSLSLASELFPGLLDIPTAINIEKILHNNPGVSIERRVMLALDESQGSKTERRPSVHMYREIDIGF